MAVYLSLFYQYNFLNYFMDKNQDKVTHNITISPSASSRVHTLMQKESGSHFRVYITGGGCYGFQYGFKLENQVQSDDILVPAGQIEVVIDPLSFQYLEGCTVDFKQDLQGARFTVKNPNAQTTCGCGSSFAV